MAIRKLKYTITGTLPLLMNNPQTVDRFNQYTKRMSEINAKKTRRTDEDYLELRDIEIRSKIFFDDEGIYVPATWVTASLEKISHGVAKIAKATMRAIVFTEESKLRLKYRGMKLVNTPEDIVKNDDFRHMMNLKQGQVRVMKAFPIFHEWSFSGHLEFEDTQVDASDMVRMLEHAARYGGYGDFRPTFGRATVEVKHV